MGAKLHLKLTVGILVVFGLLILGYVLYEPVWYRIQASRLCSGDEVTREAVIKAIAAKGKQAIPHIRRWLKSKNDKLVSGACLALENMKGDTWEQALPELTIILTNPISVKSNAAARLVLMKGYAFEESADGDISWRHFIDNREAKLKISLSMFFSSGHPMRSYVAIILGELKDTRAVKPLILALDNKTDIEGRKLAVDALGLIGDTRAVEPLIKKLSIEEWPFLYEKMLNALVNIGGSEVVDKLIALCNNENRSWRIRLIEEYLAKTHDPRVVEAFITWLSHPTKIHSDISAKRFHIVHLGRIGDKRAFMPLVNIVDHEKNNDLVRAARSALKNLEDEKITSALAGDKRAILPLLKVIEHGNSLYLKRTAAQALEGFRDNRVIAAMARNFSTSPAILQETYAEILGRSGDSRALEVLTHSLATCQSRDVRRISAKGLWIFCSVMPDGCPFIDLDESEKKQFEAAIEMKTWYSKHQHRLAWDQSERKYYLLPEGEK